MDLCADDEDPSQLIIRPGWDAPHVRCLPRTFCAWPCLLRQVGTVLGSPCDPTFQQTNGSKVGLSTDKFNKWLREALSINKPFHEGTSRLTGTTLAWSSVVDIEEESTFGVSGFIQNIEYANVSTKSYLARLT